MQVFWAKAVEVILSCIAINCIASNLTVTILCKNPDIGYGNVFGFERNDFTAPAFLFQLQGFHQQV